MTDTGPYPEPITLDHIAKAAAALIADAREAGLTQPYTLTCHDYGPPSATLYLYAGTDEDSQTRAALEQWAYRYGTRVTTHPSASPGSIHAVAKFTGDGINYEISAILRTGPAGEQHQDHDGDGGYPARAA